MIGQDIGIHWSCIRAWKWVSGGKQKNGIEAWRRGSEGMKWRTAIKKSVGMYSKHLGNERRPGRTRKRGWGGENGGNKEGRKYRGRSIEQKRRKRKRRKPEKEEKRQEEGNGGTRKMPGTAGTRTSGCGKECGEEQEKKRRHPKGTDE